MIRPGERAQENSVRNLQELYTVVVAAALAFAAERVIDVNGDSASFNMDTAWPLAALLVTLVPFYHGAVRHLEQTYIEEKGRKVRGGGLLADFLLLFIEGFIFVAVARMLVEPEAAAWGLVVLLAIDAVWGLAVWGLLYKERAPITELRWVEVNALAAPFIAVLILLPANSFTLPLVFVAFGLRTVFDYAASWKMYFPPVEEEAG